MQAALGEADVDSGGGRGGGGRLDDGAGLVGDDGVAAIQDEEGAELGELGGESLDGAAAAGELPAQRLRGGGMGLVEAAAAAAKRGRRSKQWRRAARARSGAGVVLEPGAKEIAQAEFEFVDALGLAAHGAVEQSQRALDPLLLPGGASSTAKR